MSRAKQLLLLDVDGVLFPNGNVLPPPGYGMRAGVELQRCNCGSLAKPLQLQNPPSPCQTMPMPLWQCLRQTLATMMPAPVWPQRRRAREWKMARPMIVKKKAGTATSERSVASEKYSNPGAGWPYVSQPSANMPHEFDVRSAMAPKHTTAGTDRQTTVKRTASSTKSGLGYFRSSNALRMVGMPVARTFMLHDVCNMRCNMKVKM